MGAPHDLGEVSIAPHTPFAHIYVTALGRDETVANAKRLLVTAMARMVDQGTRFDDLSTAPLVRAEPKVGPLLIEPVKAVIELKREDRCRVVALDHDGRETDPPVEVPVKRTADGARFVVDGAEYKTVYYVVEME